MPMGRKKWRSTHSSTDRPLCDKSFGGFTEHVLHDGEGAHRLVLLDDQWRGGAGLRVVDHEQHAAPEQGGEEATGGLLGGAGGGGPGPQGGPAPEAPGPDL